MNRPLVELIAALVGAPAWRLKAMVCPGSESVALAVNDSSVCSKIVLLVIIASKTGAWFVAGAPTIVKIPVALAVDCPSGLVTVIVRAPGVALPATDRFIVRFVGLL